jgi:hypothetical protein
MQAAAALVFFVACLRTWWKKCRVLRDSASFAKLCKTSVSERQQAPK